MPKRRYKNLKNLMYEQEITQQQLSKNHRDSALHPAP